MPGYDIKTPESAKVTLICPECNLLLKDAVQTGDGIRLCESCYKDIARSPKYVSLKTGISVLDEDGKPSCYPDKAVRREIQRTDVICKNSIHGCKWVGQLGHYYETHENECQYKPVSCRNKNKGCKEKLSLVEMEKHITQECDYREVSCKYCGEVTMPVSLKEHQNTCPKYPIKCSLCSETAQRENLKDHEVNYCKRMQCSCGEVFNKEGNESDSHSIAAHLNSPAVVLTHILGVLSLANTLMESIQKVDVRLAAIEAGGVVGKHVNAVQSAELTKVHAEMQRNFKFLSDRMTPLEQQLEYTKTSSKDKNRHDKMQELQTKVYHLEEKTKAQESQIRRLQAQLSHKKPPSWDTHTTPYSSDISEDSSKIMMVERKYEELERQVSMIKVHVSELELQLQASLASTHNGSFLWRIPDLPRRRRDAVDERITSIYSPPFYTGRNGYKMCIRAYLNGDGMGHNTHISLFFVLMKGEFDALLKWPFEHKVSLILVDQNHRKHIVQTFKPTPDSSSFRRPVSDMNVASGCPQFARLNVLDDDSYVKDDTIYFKCIVDTSKVFHP